MKKLFQLNEILAMDEFTHLWDRVETAYCDFCCEACTNPGGGWKIRQARLYIMAVICDKCVELIPSGALVNAYDIVSIMLATLNERPITARKESQNEARA